jgi:heterodisulfide reductase subunit C
MAMFDKPIRVSELDPSFKAEVIAHEAARDITACFSCGTCTAGCPIHEAYPEYDPRKMARMVNLGMRERVLSSPYIWYCATCHNCEQRCPQNVKFFSVLNVLKNMAAKAGYAPPSWVNQTKQVMETGIVFPTEEAWVKKREELSLRPMKSDGKEAAKLIQLTGVDKIEPRAQS